MKQFTEWGFTREGWRHGSRGEYWVVVQGFLMIGFVLLPLYRPAGLTLPSPPWLYGMWGIALILELSGLLFIGKGIGDLGQNLTPLPYPKQDGQLVQTGVYGIVRHPIYSGVILMALGWALFHGSLSHVLGTLILVIFFDAKANREEGWLMEHYPDYGDYKSRVKKLLPWLY